MAEMGFDQPRPESWLEKKADGIFTAVMAGSALNEVKKNKAKAVFSFVKGAYFAGDRTVSDNAKRALALANQLFEREEKNDTAQAFERECSSLSALLSVKYLPEGSISISGDAVVKMVASLAAISHIVGSKILTRTEPGRVEKEKVTRKEKNKITVAMGRWLGNLRKDVFQPGCTIAFTIILSLVVSAGLTLEGFYGGRHASDLMDRGGVSEQGVPASAVRDLQETDYPRLVSDLRYPVAATDEYFQEVWGIPKGELDAWRAAHPGASFGEAQAFTERALRNKTPSSLDGYQVWYEDWYRDQQQQ